MYRVWYVIKPTAYAFDDNVVTCVARLALATSLIWPPDIVVSGLIFYHGFFFLSYFFIRRLIYELSERSSNKIRHMLGSNWDLKTLVQNLGNPSPYKSGAQNHFLGRLRNLTSTLTACIVRWLGAELCKLSLPA